MSTRQEVGQQARNYATRHVLVYGLAPVDEYTASLRLTMAWQAGYWQGYEDAATQLGLPQPQTIDSYRYVPVGWSYEEADPSVGIMSGVLSHDCQGAEDMEDPVADVELGERHQGGRVIVPYLHVCKACGASFLTLEDYGPEVEPGDLEGNSEDPF